MSCKTSCHRRNALLSIGALLLSAPAIEGCTAIDFVTNRAPPKLFELSPKTTFGDDLPDIDAAVLIEPPSATAGLNTARIALRPEPTLLEYYANALWIDVVPVMVQTLATESFDATGRIDALSPADAAGVRPDFSLRIHIREFQAQYDEGTSKPPLVNIRLQARLLAMPRRDSLDTVSIQQLMRAEETSVESVVRAYDDALGKALKRLVEWSLKEIEKAENAAKG